MDLTISRRDLRKCYGRALLCCFFVVAATQLASVIAVALYYPFLAPLLRQFGIAFPKGVELILLNDLCAYGPMAIVIPLTMRKMPPWEKGVPQPLPRKELLRAIFFCIGVLTLFAQLTQLIIGFIETGTGQETENALNMMKELPIWLTAVSVMVVAPVCEEFLIRRLFLDRCRVLGDVSAILLSSVLFALMHNNLYQTFYAFFVGACLGSVAIMTNRIWECILIHACANSIMVLSMLDFGSFSGLWQLLLAVLIFGSMIFAVVTFCKRFRHYRFDPGPLPYDSAEKLTACITSPCFWICLFICLYSSVLTIFLM